MADGSGGVYLPVVGARTTDQLSENLGAIDVDLGPDQRRRIDDTRTTDA